MSVYVCPTRDIDAGRIESLQRECNLALQENIALTAERDQLKREAALQRVSDFGQIQALTEERDALRKEVERLKTVPMKYRRMAFNAQLQEENKALWERVETLEKALQTLLIERDGHYSTAAAWEAARAAMKEQP